MKRSPKAISLIIIIIVLVWVLSGAIFGTSRPEGDKTNPQSAGDSSQMLKVESLKAQPYTRIVEVNGFTEANRMVELKPEVEGKIIELPVEKGTLVKAGQVIVKLDNRDRAEKLAEAKAKVAARSLEYQAAVELQSKGFRPRIGVADSKANLEQARVDLAQAQLNFDNTQIKAPFAGRIEELNVEVGDFVLSGFFGSLEGKAMARLVEDNPIIVSGQISEKDLPVISRDASVQVVLSDGRELTGTITFVSQYADTQSRSFRVEVSVPNTEHNIPVGITATLKLPASKGSAYLVSSSVLALDDMGKVGVKIVDDKNIVQFVPVTVMDNTDQGLWIGGLPDSIRLVVQGQAFVNAGQPYAPKEGKP